ncbi:Sodium/hydrogen exchanger 4 [Turnera subulata]|uniref:Sodium/hydrogen exchanger 4 n=1 Tax=Turnera subulata TaxID=218843 RepID=A0A9Q0G0Z8_9ROSI|nr:Sodium/hydrogen exchanger 4 [Turnera subulata]
MLFLDRLFCRHFFFFWRRRKSKKTVRMVATMPEVATNLAKEHAHQVVLITVFVAVLCLCLVIGHFLEENRWVNESITAILIGCISGTLILLISKGKSSHILRFDEQLFFIYLLPPIIFNAGFQVKKKQFFQNFVTILLFGVIGVFISVPIISAGCWLLFPKLGFTSLSARDYLAIGTIFSSTDTVCTLQVLHQDETPLLYSLVFGEGVVNDATSVVLFNAIQKLDVTRFNTKTGLHVIGNFLYLFSTSTILGITCGLLTAYILKTLYFGRHSSVREIALMGLMAYLSYMLAELCDLSGILTVFFCGILMSHYAWHNVTESSRITTRQVLLETFIFLYVGMDALDIEKWKVTKVIIWWAGLMRGAVSIALAFKQFTFSGVTWFPPNATMITSTIIVVLFTTLVFGFLTKPLVNHLVPHHGNHPEPKSPKDDMTLPLLSFEESAATNIERAKDSLSSFIERPVYTIHHYWKRFDDAYMRPVFGGPHNNRSGCQ